MNKKCLLMFAIVLLMLAGCSSKVENEPDNHKKTEIGVDDDGWTSENNGEINKEDETYLSYRMVKEITRRDFIPGAMAQQGDLLYVINSNGKPSDPEKPVSPTNPPCYTIEVFNTEKGEWVRTIPCAWMTEAGPLRMIGVPRAIAVDKERVYVAYGSITLMDATRVAVFNAETGDWITCIGGKFSAQVSKAIVDVDEGTALYVDSKFLYMTDNRRPLRIYRLSDLTNQNSEKIAPYATSPEVSGTGVPHPMTIFRHPNGTLMRTDYTSKMVYALDETKIIEGADIDITDNARSVDLTEGMYNDIRFNTAFEGTTPYSIASYENVLFVAASTNNSGGEVDGLICTLNSRWEYIGAIGAVSGYTFSKPIQVLVVGDRMIVADQNKEAIVIVQITSHTMDKYE